MATVSGNVDRIQAAVTTKLPAHWKFFLIEGVLLLILGMIAIVVPLLATIAVELVVGWVILFSGIGSLILTFKTRDQPGFVWSLLSASIGIGAGLLLVIWPFSGILSLTLVLMAFLVFDGVATSMYALAHRNKETPRWGFMLFNGVIDLALAGVILWGFPDTATWVLGLIVGIDLTFGGSALIAMGLHVRNDTILDRSSAIKA